MSSTHVNRGVVLSLLSLSKSEASIRVACGAVRASPPGRTYACHDDRECYLHTGAGSGPDAVVSGGRQPPHCRRRERRACGRCPSRTRSRKVLDVRACWVRKQAAEVELRVFGADVPLYSPRIVQEAIYAFCSTSNCVEQRDDCSGRTSPRISCATALCPFAESSLHAPEPWSVSGYLMCAILVASRIAADAQHEKSIARRTPAAACSSPSGSARRYGSVAAEAVTMPAHSPGVAERPGPTPSGGRAGVDGARGPGGHTEPRRSLVRDRDYLSGHAATELASCQPLTQPMRTRHTALHETHETRRRHAAHDQWLLNHSSTVRGNTSSRRTSAAEAQIP